MSTNPYQSPSDAFGPPGGNPQTHRMMAAQTVSAPATALMIVAGICIALLALSIPFDVFLLLSGFAKRIDEDGIDPNAKIMIRLAWSCMLVAASCYVFWGALQMKRLANYRHTRAAAIVACIPCVGPCCLLGIPFGAWALSVLGRSEVAKAFES